MNSRRSHLRQHSPQWLPRITVTKGGKSERRFWQPGGGFDRNVTDPLLIEYTHADPVRRNLVLRAEDWKWSSDGWVEG